MHTCDPLDVVAAVRARVILIRRVVQNKLADLVDKAQVQHAIQHHELFPLVVFETENNHGRNFI